MFDGNPSLRAAGERYEYTEEMVREYIRCREDILYFAEKYFFIQTIDKGRIKIPLWDFQKRLLKAFIEPPNGKRHVVVLSARQMSKTTVSTIYLLHYALFQKDSNVAILANNEKTARNILASIQMAYMMLPLWLQKGVVNGGWNKGSIQLENGVKIVASSTSSSAVRGMTINCVDGSTEVTVRNKHTGEIKTIRIDELKKVLELDIANKTELVFRVEE